MSILESIKQAREEGFSDEKILAEIKRQNPEKESFFDEKEKQGKGATSIIEEITEEVSEKRYQSSLSEETTERTTEGVAGEQEFLEDSEKTKGEKEEEARALFLKRIDQKEGLSTPSPEVFGPNRFGAKKTPPPPKPEEGEVDIKKTDNIPKRPTKRSKQWIRVIITMVIIIILALSIASLYRAIFLPQPSVDRETPEREIVLPRAPSPLINLDEDDDDIVRIPITSNEEYIIKLRRAIREEHYGKITRIIIEDQKEEPRISDLEDFFLLFQITSPELFFQTVGKNFTLLLYTEGRENRLGFVAPFDERQREDMEWRIMRPWESTIERDFRHFFSFLGVEIPITEEELEKTTYTSNRRQYVIRYRSIPAQEKHILIGEGFPLYFTPQGTTEAIITTERGEYRVMEEENGWYKILKDGTEYWTREDVAIVLDSPEDDIGLYYSIANNRIIFSTSLDSIKAIIDRL